MKIEALKKRLDKNRPMTSITIRIPEDVIEDLKRVAPLLGFSGYQPLVRAYIGQGLRADLERLDGDTVSRANTYPSSGKSGSVILQSMPCPKSFNRHQVC